MKGEGRFIGVDGNGLKILVMIALISAVMIMSSCGQKNHYKLDLKNSGGIFMAYQMSKDDFTYEDEYEEGLKSMAYFIQGRVSGYGKSEVYVEKDNICVEILKEQDPQMLKDLIEKESRLYIIPQYDLNGNTNFENNGGKWELTKDINELVKVSSITLTNSDISGAGIGTQQDDKRNEQIIITLHMTDEGSKKFADMTSEAYNNNMARIAIWYDGEILSAPPVQAVITDGHAVITGFSSVEEAEKVAVAIRIGPLPHEIHQVQCEVFERKKLEK